MPYLSVLVSVCPLCQPATKPLYKLVRVTLLKYLMSLLEPEQIMLNSRSTGLVVITSEHNSFNCLHLLEMYLKQILWELKKI